MRYIPQDTVRLSDKIAYCIGAIGKDVVHGLVTGCIFIYSMQILGIQFSFLSTVFLISLLLEALTAPFIGVLLDNSRNVLNRYKFWVMLGSCLNMLFLFAIFISPTLDSNDIDYFLAINFILWSVSFNFIDLPYWAIISSFNTYSKTRNTVAAIPCISRHIGLQCITCLLMAFFARQNSPFIYFNQENYLYCAMGAILLLFLSQALFISILRTGNISTSYTPDYRKGHSQSESHEEENQGTLQDSRCCVPPTPPEISSAHLDFSDPSVNYAILHANQRARQPYFEQMRSRQQPHPRQMATQTLGLNSFNTYRPETADATLTSPKNAFTRTEQMTLSVTEGAKLSRKIKAAQKAPRLNIRSFFSILFKNDQLLVIIATDIMLHLCFTLMFSSLFLFFLDKHIGQQPSIMMILIAGAVLQLFSMSTFNSFVQKTTRATVFITSVLLINGGFALLLAIDNTYTNQFYTLVAISIFVVNIGIGLCKVSLTAMTADTVDYGEFKMSVRTEGIIFAASCMASRLGLVLALFIYFFSTHSLGEWIIRIPTITHSTWLSIASSAMVSSILGFITLLLYVNFYKLNGAFYRNILNNLQFLRLNQRPNTQAEPSRFMLRYSLDTSTMFIKLKAKNQDELIHALVQKLVEVNAISSEHDYMIDLNARLELSACGIAEGIAIPHAKSDAVHRATVVVATLDSPIDLGAFDEQKCDLIFLLASPDDGFTHLNLLGRLSLLLNEPGFADKLRTAGSPTELFDRLVQCEKHIMI